MDYKYFCGYPRRQTVPCVDHPPFRWIRQHLLFRRWIWSESTRPGILRGSWLVDCNDQGAWMWTWYHGSCSHTFGWGFVYIDYILRILVSLCCQHMLCAMVPFNGIFFCTPSVKDELFTRVWNSKIMFLTPPTHTHNLAQMKRSDRTSPPFLLIVRIFRLARILGNHSVIIDGQFEASVPSKSRPRGGRWIGCFRIREHLSFEVGSFILPRWQGEVNQVNKTVRVKQGSWIDEVSGFVLFVLLSWFG